MFCLRKPFQSWHFEGKPESTTGPHRVVREVSSRDLVADAAGICVAISGKEAYSLADCSSCRLSVNRDSRGGRAEKGGVPGQTE